MADVASSPAATGASTPVTKEKKNVVEKPERPDQATYEKELAEAEKKLQVALERQVRYWNLTVLSRSPQPHPPL